MGNITFILGGARSGKSSYAIELAKKIGTNTAFIATCIPLDEEMRLRIQNHKEQRPSEWQTFEEPKDVAPLIQKIGSRFDLIIIDCLTILITNLLLNEMPDEVIEKKINDIVDALASTGSSAIIVSNEVGLGIVPDNPLSRRFRDLAGRINQMVSARADEVYFMVSGLKLPMKGRGQ